VQRRRLRLIHAGRLLPDGTQLVSWLGTHEERQQRATTRGKDDVADPTSLLPAATGGASAPVPWLHCSVGATISDGEDEGETQTQVRQLPSAPHNDSSTHDLTARRRTAHASHRRRKSSLYAALIASAPQASPRMTSSTFEGSSTHAQPRTI
jgi:hypothetical protein